MDHDAPAPETQKVKKRRKSGILINILLAVSILGLVVALAGLIITQLRYKVADDEYLALQEQYLPAREAEETPATAPDFDALRAINPDVVAWVELPGTKLSYPVVQGQDNDYYLTHTFEGTANPSGAVFMDYRSEADFSLANTIVYGHNMKDGSMFHVLVNYMGKDGDAFKGRHPTLTVYTPTATWEYEVLWVKEVDVEDPLYRLPAADEASAASYIQGIGGESAGLSADDKVLTLSTCLNDYDDETPLRIVLQAVRRGEVQP